MSKMQKFLVGQGKKMTTTDEKLNNIDAQLKNMEKRLKDISDDIAMVYNLIIAIKSGILTNRDFRQMETKFELKAGESNVFTEDKVNFEITNLSEKTKKIRIEIK